MMKRRARYDRYGHAGLGNAGNGFSGAGMTMEDIFSSFGDIFGDAFGGFGGFSGSRRSSGRRVNKGSNLQGKSEARPFRRFQPEQRKKSRSTNM